IQKELGEDEGGAELREIREKIEQAGMPEAVKEKALKEVSRLEKIPQASPETGVIRTYVDWLVSLPCSKAASDDWDIQQAAEILDEDHYGLPKIKDRILEYMAVRKRAPGLRAPILSFVGPPGVGKTSLGKSIARAMGRKFIRMSLGGIRDEAEIRGHRRTYVGALPGRILQNMKTAGEVNPVFMLDEIDKVGADFRGDPSSALLEVLDPEQNNTFSDHYLEVPYDLSKVIFITTANIENTLEKVAEYLGPQRFDYGLAEEEDQVGAATGVSVSEAGGDVLTVEATVIDGKDEDFTLTGQIGKVMEESARAALSYVRAHER